MEDFNFGDVEVPDNYETKTICCFVLDVSGSMTGNPINELNSGLQEFHQEISENPITKNRLEVALVEFCHEVNVVQTPALADNFTIPTLVSRGSTAMVDGVREAISLVEERKEYYKNSGQKYKRPWIILITDGAPDRGQDISGLEKEIEIATKGKKFIFLPIGVEGADMSLLSSISGYNKHQGSWVKMQALKLQGIKFMEFFKWLSDSMSNVSGDDEGGKLADPGSGLFDMSFDL